MSSPKTTGNFYKHSLIVNVLRSRKKLQLRVKVTVCFALFCFIPIATLIATLM